MRSVRNGIGSLLLAMLLAAPGPAHAQSALLEEAVGLSGLAMFMESGAIGMVLAVVQGDDEIVVGFGETAKGSGQEPDGKSLLRLGSNLESVRRRAARRSGGRRAAEPDRPAAALRAGGHQRSRPRRPDDHAARPRDPCGGPAARAAAGSAAERGAVRLADRRRPLRLAGRLHPALGARQRRRLLQRRLRSARRRAGDRHGQVLCGSAARADHRPARHVGHRARAQRGAVRAPDDRLRHPGRRRGALRRHRQHRRQRRPVLDGGRHGALAAPQSRARRSRRLADPRAQPCGLSGAHDARRRDRVRRGGHDGRHRARLAVRGGRRPPPDDPAEVRRPCRLHELHRPSRPAATSACSSPSTGSISGCSPG